MEMEKYCYGVDVGGTSVKIGLFDSSEKLIHKWEIPTRKEENGRHILGDIAEAMKAEMKERGIGEEQMLGAGIGVPGPVTPDGIVNRCVNVGWGILPIEKELSDLFYSLPVQAGNDANVAALGEARFGGGRGFSSMIMVTLGTGVGGGVILDGKILPGHHGAAGEIGHMAMYPDAKVPCNCGNTGCMEQIASATGIVNKARELLAENSAPSVLRSKDPLTAKDVMDAYADGDWVSVQTVGVMTDTLGKGLAAAACVVDPEAFVIGGGVSRAGQWLIDLIHEKYRKYAFHASRDAKVVRATLGNDAGIYGSAAMILPATGF